MSRKNWKLLLAYDGTAYLGWQKNNVGPSIEETLQCCLEQILQQPTPLQAASRTDAGVHAEGQVVQFFAEEKNELLRGVNALLPPDISALALEEADPSFHPTLDAVGKEYRYEIRFGKIQQPKERHYCWHFPYTLNLDWMKEAAEQLTGTHDFAAFCNFRKDLRYEDTVRTIKEIRIELKEPDRITLYLTGNRFLYKMARNLAGTLAYIGCGKLKPEEIPLILKNRDRKQAGVTAPAHGLTLFQVFYDNQPNQ